VKRQAGKTDRAKARAANRARWSGRRDAPGTYDGPRTLRVGSKTAGSTILYDKVSGDGRTVTGVCKCGRPAATDCAICGPQCLLCFMTENVNDHAP